MLYRSVASSIVLTVFYERVKELCCDEMCCDVLCCAVMRCNVLSCVVMLRDVMR